MSANETNINPATSLPPRLLRLWPGIGIVAVQLILRFLLPAVWPGDTALMIAVLGAIACGPVLAIWWLFFSRAAWTDRLGGLAAVIAALAAGRGLVHASIGTGMQGLMFFYLVIPPVSLAFVIWAVAARRLAVKPRRVLMVGAILLAAGALLVIRSNGITGEMDIDYAWRWADTAEDELMDTAAEQFLPAPSAPPAAVEGADWPGFRGTARDSVVHGTRIATDWTASPPVEMWRRPIGPGCSSFAIRGGLFYTQEQRGEEEVVSCYDLETGKPVWKHSDKARFWDSHAGAGPRATPTVSSGRIYTVGGTGIVNALHAHNGSPIWSRNAVTDTKATIPGWGIAGSPLVVGDTVVVAAVGMLAGYEAATGELRWVGPNGPDGPHGGDAYSSPHLVTLDGVPQVVLMNTAGATSVSPADGVLLWEHPWPTDGRIVQPALTADGELVISWGGIEKGLRRLAPVQGPDGWQLTERWTSRGLKPNFNDTVLHKGHAYGFDGTRLGCIDLATGERTWRGGRYAGFTILLADQDLLLVLSEQGEVALVRAVPEAFTELGRFKAIEGRTWNVPAMAGNVLLVRNAIEMAAFKLAPAGQP